MKKVLLLLVVLCLFGCHASANQKEEEGLVLYDVEVLEVREDRFLIQAHDEPFGDTTIFVLVSPDTEFYNCQQSDIQVGDHINAHLSEQMMMSLPPQATAFDITLIK